jgi:hypothetical protein
MQRIFSRRKLVTVAVAVVALAAAGLVSAAWLANGTGSGYAKAGTASALTTVDVSASTTASLYPGVSGNVTLRVSNPNPYPVRVTSVTNGTGSITPDAAHAAGCTTTGVTFTNQTGLTLDVPASGATTQTLNGAATMSNASSDGCQGATFTIPVNLTGASNAP